MLLVVIIAIVGLLLFDEWISRPHSRTRPPLYGEAKNEP